jgi:acyl-coenzyme A synthetase/AMP-(fatty) acid ligase
VTVPLLQGAPTAVSLADPNSLRAFGERPALFDGAWTSYAELADLVQQRIARLGAEPAVVAVAERRDVSTVAWMIAALGGGHALLMHDERGDEILRTYRPVLRVQDDRLHQAGDRIPLHPELSMLLSTSGTTGSPKLVRLSAAGIDANAAAIAEYLGLTADDRTITTLPLSYCYGLSVLTSHLSVGAALVLTELSVVDTCFWDLARTTGVTTLPGVPYTFDLLQQVGFNGRETLPTLRRVTQAGGRLAPEHVRDIAQLAQRQAWDFYVMYGQTEATARMAYLPPQCAIDNPDCVGVAIPGGSLRIDDGEVVYSGPNVMMGYAHSPADLARGNEVTELRTGDLGEFTVDGLLRIAGRAANRAKLFGLRIDLDHVESMVRGSAAVVVGDTLAVVVEGDTRGLAARIAQRTGLPEYAVHVESRHIPRLPSGKIDRQALAATIHLPETPTPSDTIEGIKQALRTTLGRDVGDDDTFVSLGGDSLAYVAASVRLEKVLRDLPRGWHLMTVRELVATAEPVRRRWALTETSVVLRAIAVLLVVSSHTSLINVRGGAHLLLALAGFNFARCVLPPTDRAARIGRALAGFLVPAALWLTLVIAASQEFGLSVIGVTFSDLPGDDPAWRYWFVEVFALALLIAGALTIPRRLMRIERASPVLFAAAVLAVSLAARELLVPNTVPGSLFTLAASMWVFALGWLLGVLGETRNAKIAASLLVLALVVPFFENPTRDLVIGLGLVLLIWVPNLRLPRPVVTTLGAIAAASLVIYLTHWQVYPPFDQWPAVAAGFAVAAGVAIHRGLQHIGLLR